MIEHWDKSWEKARELRLDQWGTTEEVAVMAAPLRWARNRKEATAILKEIAGHSPFTSKSGLTARLQRRSVGKLAVSFCPNGIPWADRHNQIHGQRISRGGKQAILD
jgi:hypothetical protein